MLFIIGGGGSSLFLAVQSSASKSTTPSSTLKTVKAEQKVPDTKQSAPAKSENKKQQKPPTPDNKQSEEPKKLTKADPSPLIPPKRPDGESPPKVIKRKAPVPVADDTSKQQEKSVSQQPPEKLLSQQPKSGTGETKPKPPENQTVIDMPGSSAVIDMPGPSEDVTPSPKEHSIPSFEVTLSNSENSNNINMSIEPELIASSSTEQLITSNTSSPAPLRPVRRIEDVNTIKRQPKGGWL